MNIANHSYKNSISFKSKNNPIAPFEINTKQGKLFAKEFTIESLNNQKELDEFSKVVIDNYIDGSVDPGWKRLALPENYERYKRSIPWYGESIKSALNNDDGNNTILIAKNSKGEIKAGLVSRTFSELNNHKDPESLYLRTIIVDKEYRNNDVGKALIQKQIEAAKNNFSDLILSAYNKAVPFYKKIGLVELNLEDIQQKAVFDEFRKVRNDLPDYSTIMSKTLNENLCRWWKRALK